MFHTIGRCFAYIIILIVINNISCDKKKLRIRKLPNAIPLPPPDFSTDGISGISLQKPSPRTDPSYMLDMTPVYAMNPSYFHTIIPYIDSTYDSYYNSSYLESYSTSPVYPTPISTTTHELSSTTHTLSTTTTYYIGPNTHEFNTTPWDAPALASMVVEPGMCTFQQCDAATNQIFEIPVPCGCHPGQKPTDLPIPKLPLPECYMNNDGYLCCDREMEQVLNMAFMEFKESRCNRQNSDNLQTLTNMCQKRLETTFPNKTFETFVGSADFAAKMYFSGGYMCKIRRECKIIMAFASPNQEDEPESPTEPTNPPDTQPTGAPETNPTPTPPEAPLPTPTANPYYPVNPNPDMNPEDLFGLLARFLCFSGDTEVLTLDGGYKRLYDLNVGDYVLSSNLKYTKIIGWLHKIPTLEAKFLKIYLNNGQFLKITEKHLIYKADCSAFSTTSVVNKDLIFAEELSIGDCLYVVDQTISNVVIQRIEKIETITETGVYAPETLSGDIVVNGVIASCYTEVKKHVVINIFKQINFYTNQFISWFYGDINTPTELIDLPLTANLIINTIDGILPLKIFLN